MEKVIRSHGVGVTGVSRLIWVPGMKLRLSASILNHGISLAPPTLRQILTVYVALADSGSSCLGPQTLGLIGFIGMYHYMYVLLWVLSSSQQPTSHFIDERMALGEAE